MGSCCAGVGLGCGQVGVKAWRQLVRCVCKQKGEGGATWYANSGTMAVFHAWEAWRASFLAMGEPFEAGGCVAVGFGGGVVSLGGAWLDCR